MHKVRIQLTYTMLACLACLFAGSARAEERASQVFFRGGYSLLTNDRGGEVFSDTLGTLGKNDGKGGVGIGAGLDLALIKQDQLKGITLLGEVFVEYSSLSNKRVLSTTDFLLNKTGVSTGPLPTTKVRVSELNVTIAPKIRFDMLGMVRPYVVPVGLAFLVNSPPSNGTTYLDLGLQFACGVDLKLLDFLSVGADVRYTHGFQLAETKDRYVSFGGYAGVNF